MSRRTRRLHQLHPDFVAKIRPAWELDLSRRPTSYRVRWQILAGAIYWETEDGRPSFHVANDSRLQRLATAVGYSGPLTVSSVVTPREAR
jgi:hypothetical protein